MYFGSHLHDHLFMCLFARLKFLIMGAVLLHCVCPLKVLHSSAYIVCLLSFGPWLCNGCELRWWASQPLQISLQHALYLLHHGMLEDANRNLSQAETWRYGEKSSSQEVLINLIQAYKGLLQYYTWSKKKMELSQLGECI